VAASIFEDFFHEDTIMSDQKPNFSHLEAMKVKSSATAIYTFHEIEGEPSLLVKPAHEINQGYMNAVLKKGKKMLRSMKRGKLTTAVLKENREQDYQLFPRFIVEGWPTAPKDMEGKEVPFTRENCELFLRAIPVEMFNDLRDFCGDIDNFRDDEDDDLDAADREDLAGN
jgi:hypothetical protein